MAGTATFVLHTHLPYCRLAGRWPHGEEWIHEALLECYLPLLRAFQELSASVDGSLGVTINLTPILAEQLRDPLVQQHFGLVHLPLESYYVDTVPVELSIWPLLALDLGTLAVCITAMVLPTHLVSRIAPARAIRFD